MNPSQLKSMLDRLPQDKPILCQIVDKTGNAFNGMFDLLDVADSWMIQLRISHPSLVDLYDILSHAEEEAKPHYHVQAVAMIVKRVTVIMGGGLTIQHNVSSEFHPAVATLLHERSMVEVKMGPASDLRIMHNGVVKPHESEPSIPKFIAGLLRS